MAKKAVEQTGLIPRSIIRTFDRFRKQLFPEAEKLIIQEFRISRYQFLVSIKCLATLLFIPFTVNYLLKNFVLIPVTENVWNTHQSEIFLNSYQQDRAFDELKKFQEKLYFEYLVNDVENLAKIDLQNNVTTNSISKHIDFEKPDFQSYKPLNLQSTNKNSNLYLNNEPILYKANTSISNKTLYIFGPARLSLSDLDSTNLYFKPELLNTDSENPNLIGKQLSLDSPRESLDLETIQQKVQQKTLELAMYYNHQSILALTNLIGDFITFLVISLLLIYMKPQIIILKSFLTESIYSLNDTKKSFLLILGTDLLVGFHSPRGWEICLELVLRHFGFPENKDFVFLFVASFPVLLDTVFKYWIFRYLNKISPSTVATYHSMIE